MSEQSLTQIGNFSTALVRRQEAYWFHVREAGKQSRKAFTDSIQKFCEYTDPDGNKSSDPAAAYLRYTTMLYSPLGLNSRVIHRLREEQVSLHNLRDCMNSAVIFGLSTMEDRLATWIDDAMKAKALRSTIKNKMREEALRTAAFCDVPPKAKPARRKAA